MTSYDVRGKAFSICQKDSSCSCMLMKGQVLEKLMFLASLTHLHGSFGKRLQPLHTFFGRERANLPEKWFWTATFTTSPPQRLPQYNSSTEDWISFSWQDWISFSWQDCKVYRSGNSWTTGWCWKPQWRHTHILECSTMYWISMSKQKHLDIILLNFMIAGVLNHKKQNMGCTNI